MEREKFGSRLGFILISAGCAIGIGNVWRFPYVAGNNGGGIFVLLYMLFLLMFGIPVLSMELAMGRASKSSIIRAYHELERPGQKWHIHGYLGMIGNYILLFFYTTVSGWMLGYFIKYVTGDITKNTDSSQMFADVTANPWIMFVWMAVIVLIAVIVCSMGLQNGVEKITKYMMLILLGLIVVLAIHSLTLDGAGKGMRYFLVPDMNKIEEVGLGNIIIEAMKQAFFTLSVGMGSMMIFGSYIGKERALVGEGIQITLLDTFVAIMSGVIIFPACMSYNIPTDSGPSLIFVTLPKVFEHMSGGRFWGAMFFLFMTFAALSTVIAVLENIIACNMEAFRWSRKKAGIINLFIIIVMSIPCILGFNVLSGFTPLGAGTNVLDLEDFLVSSLILPIGSLVILLFCTTKLGWGYDNYMNEVNTGKGIGMPKIFKFYLKYILPLVILFIIIDGLI
ncbi:MAG TPA: sodium-dependent transporter [Eubacterium sp.]|nr:sodium-dependent transporter [Eubacterium sp.]HCO36079.1 sodium-dependent transporter [Eubacterium sp.]